jgi:hypothetical protein
MSEACARSDGTKLKTEANAPAFPFFLVRDERA